MRGIKFRAWDKDGRHSRDGKPRMLTIYTHPSSLASIISDVCLGSEIENVELSQYTGLKDKNGVEIYEGDIIKHYWESESDEGWQYVPVFYDSDCAMFKAGDHEIYLEEYAEDGEVIGNIYENPELIDGKE